MNLDIQSYLNGQAFKIMRMVTVAALFIGCITFQGVSDLRQVHMIVFMLAMISLFSLVLWNVWVTLFLLWTVFLYSYFKFTTGNIYLSYILFGCIYYFIVKISFKKEHIGFFINGFLWFLCLNVFYMAVQALGYDFIFSQWAYDFFTGMSKHRTENVTPCGFMGHVSIMASLIAMGVPLLASRGSKWAWCGAGGLLFPLYILHTSLCFLIGGAGLLFVLYFKIPRKIFLIMICVVLLCGSFYVKNVDKLGMERLPMWHKILRDGMKHPITGWGLDSFSNVTPQKNFKYSQVVNKVPFNVDNYGNVQKEMTSILWWDNPHNLYISLFYEFGFVGLFLFIGYIRQNVLRFKNCIKSPDAIALAGFVFVFLCISIGHFPIFLARTAICIIPVFALLEITTS